MSLCWKDTTPVPTGFPIFRDGKILICGGKLATTCCPDGYYYVCGSDFDVDPDGSGEFTDPSCSAPTAYPSWVIGTPCFCGACGGSDSPQLRLRFDGTTGTGSCDFAFAVLNEWPIGELVLNFFESPVTATGTWTVTIGSMTASCAISAVKGQPIAATIAVTGDFANAFSTAGVHAVQSRVWLNGGGGLAACETKYAYSFAMGSASRGAVLVYPDLTYEFTDGDACMKLDGNDDWILDLVDLKGGFETQAAAEAVVASETYGPILEAYAKGCVCPSCAELASEGFWQVEDDGTGGARWIDDVCTTSGQKCVPAPCLEDWRTIQYSVGAIPGECRVQVKNGATAEWQDLDEGVHSFTVPPCGEFIERVWVDGGDYTANPIGASWLVVDASEYEECAVEEADWQSVPGTTLHETEQYASVLLRELPEGLA